MLEPKSPFEEVAHDLGKLVTRKNQQYGDSAAVSGKMLEVLYPSGIPVAAYTDAMLIVRVLDKLCRISRGDQGDESAWRDVAGYGLIGAVQSSPGMKQGQGGDKRPMNMVAPNPFPPVFTVKGGCTCAMIHEGPCVGALKNP